MLDRLTLYTLLILYNPLVYGQEQPVGLSLHDFPTLWGSPDL